MGPPATPSTRLEPGVPSPSWAALGAASAGLVGYNAALNLVPLPDPLYVPTNLALTGVVILAGRRAGIGTSELGLHRAEIGRGVLAGGAVVAVVGLGLLGVQGVPAAEAFLADERAAGLAGLGLAYAAMVRIPLGTAVPEEFIFRGVLVEAFGRRVSEPAAVIAASLVFGLWHIGPALRLLEVNEVDIGVGATAAVVAGSVLATTAAGVGFWLLRKWSRSLVAPIVAHAGINALSLLAAVAAQRSG